MESGIGTSVRYASRKGIGKQATEAREGFVTLMISSTPLLRKRNVRVQSGTNGLIGKRRKKLSAKTLRFEPYPASKEESRKDIYDKKTGKLNWTGAIDIPEDSDVRIEALPSRHLVFEGKVTDSITKNFQPGKYIYTMEKFLHARQEGVPGRSICTEGTFLVDVTEDQWQDLMFAQPKNVTSRQTTNGPRVICTLCNKQSDTRLAAFLHEAREHMGVDPLKDPQKAVEIELRATAIRDKIGASKQVETFGGTDAKMPSGS